jgi:hypothetical protein
MKSILFFFITLSALLICSKSSAQNQKDSAYIHNYNQSSLIYKVNKSDIVVEGRVINLKYFNNDRNTISAIIRISKLFKGNVSDTTLELVFDGGVRTITLPDNTTKLIGYDQTYSFSVQKGDEGVFLLNDNKTGRQLQKDLQSYIVTDVWLNDILYSQKKGEHYIASCEGAVFKDVEKDVFQVIESTTGQKTKVLSQNSFEASDSH